MSWYYGQRETYDSPGTGYDSYGNFYSEYSSPPKSKFYWGIECETSGQAERRAARLNAADKRYQWKAQCIRTNDTSEFTKNPSDYFEPEEEEERCSTHLVCTSKIGSNFPSWHAAVPTLMQVYANTKGITWSWASDITCVNGRDVDPDEDEDDDESSDIEEADDETSEASPIQLGGDESDALQARGSKRMATQPPPTKKQIIDLTLPANEQTITVAQPTATEQQIVTSPPKKAPAKTAAPKQTVSSPKKASTVKTKLARKKK